VTGLEVFFNGLWLWMFGLMPAAPAMFFLGRYGRGDLAQRRRRAALRTVFWPATVLFALMDVIFVLFGKAADIGAAGLMALLTTPRDRRQAEIEQAEKDLESATRDAEKAEDARDAMDKAVTEFIARAVLEEELGDPGLAGIALRAQESEQSDFVDDHELVTNPPEANPHGRVCYVEKTLAVHAGQGIIRQIDNLEEHSLLWKCEKTGYWHLVRDMSEVPAGWPMWQLSRNRSDHRLLKHTVALRFYGYNTETGLPR
jgi:hypothetical protein